MEKIISNISDDSKFVNSMQIKEIKEKLLSLGDVDENLLNRILDTIYDTNLKIIESKLANNIKNSEFITAEFLKEIKDFLLYQSDFNKEGINNILFELYKNNTFINSIMQKENNEIENSLEQRNQKASVESIKSEDTKIVIEKNEYNEDLSLKLDISFYITLLNNATSYDEVAQYLPDKNTTRYLEIIDSILVYYYNELFELKRFLKIDLDEDFLEYQKVLENRIDYIKKYKKVITSSKEKIIKQENILIFLTTNRDNVCIKSDILKSIDPEHYADIKMLLESIKNGTFREAKSLTNSNLSGLSEVRAHPHQSRVTFKQLIGNIYVVLQAFVKKTDFGLMHQNAMTSRYDLYKSKTSILLERVKDPNFILENEKIYDDIKEILSNQKRGDSCGKIKRIN